MHLINTTTLELEYFIGGCPQPYAILSHTWENDEVTFADISGKQPETYETKAGFDKIRRTCSQAKQDGLQYAWVDTCCINKDSSAELSEAINSMYMWYKKATLCYAYITDFRWTHDTTKLRGCRWFSRGWTLQELLAPMRVIFYGKAWTLIGTKRTMLKTLEQITGIPMEILSGRKALHTVTVAARMSWAAKRDTSRVEDQAYCLLGIFDVNMPLLYGEGSKAFLRLQSEIMNQTQDDSLFAWCADEESAANFPYRGLFASSPMEFEICGDIKSFGVDTDSVTTVFGNGRISLSCGLETRDLLDRGPETMFRRSRAAIKCYRKSILYPLAIEVTCIGVRTYVRSNPSNLIPVSMRPFNQDIIIEKFAQKTELLAIDDVHQRGSVHIGDLPETMRFVETFPSELRNSTERKLSAVDVLEAGRVAFRFELIETGYDIFLIIWVSQTCGATSYWYHFDVVSVLRQDLKHVQTLTKFLSRSRKRKATEMSHEQNVSSEVRELGQRRKWADTYLDVGSGWVRFSPSREVVDGHRVEFMRISIIP